MRLNKISKSFFINLDRRTDRLDHIYKHVPFYTERFTAVDANTLELNDEIKKLFPKTYYLLSKAEIACALSHYKLWKQLAADTDAKSYLILEDDVVFEEGFVEQWNNQFSKVFPHDFMLVYVGGCQPWNKSHYNEVLDPFNQHFNNVKKNDFFTKGDHYWHMNASSYIVSRRAATLLCQYVDQLGFNAAWDVFIINFFNNNKIFTCPHLVYHLNPLMARQIHEENENIEADKNSDIRFNKDRFYKNKNKNKISVIIPTIWKGDLFMMESLLRLDQVNSVSEVIVINNDPSKTPDWIHKFKKVKLMNSEKRMYFNESVNFGIDLCKNNICCIYNDDITTDVRIFNFVLNNFNKNDGCLFISPNYINCKSTTEGNLKPVNDIIKDELYRGGGMLMFVHKDSFIKIPKLLVHHFGDTFIFNSNVKLKKQNYAIEGFPIQTPGSASEDSSVRQVIRSDWQVHKDVFNNIDYYINSIPKTLHISWPNKDILSSNSPLILNGLKNFEKINPDWKIEISNDQEVDEYIKKHVSPKHYNLIKDKKMTQKTDLWRLLKVFHEGGLYIDIDRYVNIPMSKIIKKNTKCILPICGQADFSQDFVCGVPNYYIHKNAVQEYLSALEAGRSLFDCAVISYMHSVSTSLCGYKAQRRPGAKFWNDAIYKINHSPEIESFIEGSPFNKILFKHDPETFIYLNGKTEDLDLEFKNQKAEFYNSQSVVHWNADDRKYNENYKQKSKKIKLIWQVDPNNNKETYESDWLRELLSDIDYEEVVDCNYSVLQDDSIIIYTDIWHHTKNDTRQEILYNYLDKASKHKNVSIIHLGDEYTQARTDHYKNFKLAIRTTYNHSVRNVKNLIQIPLGYKQGFHD